MKKPIQGSGSALISGANSTNLSQSTEINNSGRVKPVSIRENDDFSDVPLIGEKDTWFNPVDPFHAPVEPLEWIIEGMAAKGMITLLGGVAGSGKSILIQYLLQLRGRQSLINAVPGKAIFLTGLDSSETEIRRRAKSIGEGTGLLTVEIPDHIIPFITNQVFFDELSKKIIEHDVDVIVFDTLADFHEGSLYEAADANATMSAFRRLATGTGCAIILITHIRKSADLKTSFSVHDVADSRIFGTKSDFVFPLKSEYQNDSTNLIEIQCPKARSPKPMPPLRALIEYDEYMGKLHIEQTGRPFSVEADEMEEERKRSERRRKAWELKQEGKSNREIGEELGVSHVTIAKDLKLYENTESDTK